MDRTFVSETRRGYVPVGSAPAFLLATVSETKMRSMSLERSPFLRHLCLGELQRFKPELVGQQWVRLDLLVTLTIAERAVSATT
jgi:hypothetical protein